MAFQPGANVYTQGFGSRPENAEVAHIDVRAPNSTDILYPISKRWVNTVSGNEYTLMSISTAGGVAAANWGLLGGTSGALNTLTTQDAAVVTPAAGNIDIVGVAPISTTGAGDTVSVNLTGVIDVANGGTGVATLTAHGVLIGEGTSDVVATAAGTNGQVLLGSTGADPAFGTLTTTTGVAFTTGAGSLAVNVATGGYKINIASTGTTAVIQNGYTVTQAAQTSFALPTTAAVGDRFFIASATGNTNGWIITQAANQKIWAGASTTTTGVTGTLAGAIHTSVELMCEIANLEFIVVGGSGLTGLTFT